MKSLVQTRDTRFFSKALGEIDYFTILLLAGLFIVVGGITEAGVVEDISRIFVEFSNNNVFLS